MIPNNIINIMQKIIDNNGEAYIIGGAVRDTLLGQVPHDWDIFTNLEGFELLRIFPKGHVLGNDERQEKILTVMVGDTEVSSYRINGNRTEIGGTLEEHIQTCDLTINSMAMDINGKIMDIVGGKLDLAKGIIRTVGDADTRFEEDYLRILRAIRFKLKYGFMLEIKTHSSIIKLRSQLKTLPIERIRDELIKIMAYSKSIDFLIDNGIMKHFIPELCACFGIDGGEHHDEDIQEHLIGTYKTSLTLTDDWRIHWACLFHDIGKPVVKGIKEDGTTSFYQHETEGYGIVKRILKRFKFSNADVKFISTLVLTHMQGYGRTKSSTSSLESNDSKRNNDMGKKAYIRFFNKLEDAGISIEQWHIVRFSDSQGNLKKERYKYCDSSKYIIQKYYQLKYSREPFSTKDLEVSGSDIVDMGITGKRVGELLNCLFNKIMDGELDNHRPLLMKTLREMI